MKYLAINQKLPGIQRQVQEKKCTIEKDTQLIQTLELPDTEYKITLTNMFKMVRWRISSQN